MRGRHCALVALLVGTALSACSSSKPSAKGGAPAPRVLLVGTYNGHAGAYSTIQSAVDAARPGDWVLIAPGDYHDARGGRSVLDRPQKETSRAEPLSS